MNTRYGAGGGIQGDLTGGEEHVAVYNGLGVGADGAGGLISCDFVKH